MRRTLQHIPVLCFALLFLSCEKEKSTPLDVALDSPFIGSLALGTGYVNLDTTTGSAVHRMPDGSYTISDSAIVSVSFASGAAQAGSVSYHLVQPGGQSEFASGTIGLASAISNGERTIASYRGAFSFSIDRPDIGAYLVQVTAEDGAGLPSNTLSVSLVITRNNIPPLLFGLNAPDTLHRPVSGTRPVFFAVTARDSDGALDITKVFFKSINSSNPNFEFQLFDDGNRAVTGDSVANDGRYSRVLPIDSTATLGAKIFRFWARDKSGALSDSISHTITILP